MRLGAIMTKEEIISVLAELHNITGFRVSLHGADYSEIAAYPKEKCALCRLVHGVPSEYEKCVASDKAACRAAIDNRDTHIYKCRFGMTEAVSPLYNFGTLTGFLMMGQVYDEGENIAYQRDILSELGIDNERLDAALTKIRRVDACMVRSFVKIMTICAQYLTLSHAIPKSKPSVAQLAKEYISSHFHRKITIQLICTEIGCSKSALITAFKREYGTTVNQYLTEVRLAEAVHLIENGECTIGEVAEACGFSDQSYFSKVFSARYGVPPSEYIEKADRTAKFWE